MRSLSSSPDVEGSSGPGVRTWLWTVGFLFGLAAEWLARSGQSLGAALGDLTAGWTLIACGLIAWSRRPRSLIGMLLTATGFTWFLGTLVLSDARAIASIGSALLFLHRGPLFHAIIGYPSGRLSRRSALVVVALCYVCATIVPIAENDVATIVVAGLVLATTLRGYVLATGPDRQARVTAIAAAAAVALVLGGGCLVRLLGTNPEADAGVLWAYEAVLVLLALGFLADLLWGRWTQAAVTKLVVELGEPSETGTLRDRVAGALGDPSLLLAYWVPEVSAYVNERGDPVSLPEPSSDRAVTLIDQGGDRIAALVHDPAVLDDPALVDAVASAAGIAISNVRLQAEVRRRVAEVAASRRRIVEAGDAQRRRLQQELRQGVERRLVDAGGLLELVRQDDRLPDDAAAAARFEEVEEELQGALAEVRELAAGIHPSLMTDRGLWLALSTLAERSPIPVDLAVPLERLPADIEAAVYFVCSEALANVAKHARASRVSIDLIRDDRGLSLAISDDGIGGADPTAGSGLRGLADRIEALGGQLRVEGPPSGGSRVLADFPTVLRT